MPAIRPRSANPSRDEIDRLVARGRRLQSEAILSGFKQFFRLLAGSGSLRSLRVAGQRQPCA